MNCKKCGKKMPNGARFCISCGAEHDSSGNLIDNVNKIDYNKTMMASDANVNNKIDYNKTLMAGDLSQNQKVDYNKTMMANDSVVNNQSQSHNNLNVLSGKKEKPNNNSKKGIPKILIIIIIVLVIIIIFKIFIVDANKNKNLAKKENKQQVQTETEIETTTVKNVVSDFNSNEGYWSKDAEFFYKNGTIQKNQWIGDFYLGEDGRKVRNKLIDDTYYVDASGKKVKNEWYKFTKNIDGADVNIWYYLGDDGAKLRDTLTPDGYYVDKDGIYIQGEHDSPDSKNYTEK